MPGKNIVELAANNMEVDGSAAFEASFTPTEVHELMVEMDPKHCGPPVCVLSDGAANSKEFHPLPQAGREGRYVSKPGGGATYSKLRLTMARNVKARLVRVKIIAHGPTPAGTSPAPTH